MGSGRAYKCYNCGTKFTNLFGSGMFYSLAYKETIEDIRNGKYGDYLKTVFHDNCYSVVDIDRYLYVCECGNWSMDKRMDLYLPIDTETIKRVKYVGKPVDEIVCAPYAISLRDDYRLVKKYDHICEKCNSVMKEYNDNDDVDLKCPNCNNTLSSNIYEMIFWD